VPAIDQDIKRLAQDVDTKTVLKTGSTMTGQLTLPGTNPTSTNHATRKGYVDELTAPVEIKTYFPTDRNWAKVAQYITPTSTGTGPCWAYDFSPPVAGVSYVVTANLGAAFSVVERALFRLRFTNSNGYYTYKPGPAASVYQNQANSGSAISGGLSITAWAELPANASFAVKLEVETTLWSTGTTPPWGFLKNQILTVTAYPRGKAWA
jgi:hypothetical protein